MKRFVVMLAVLALVLGGTGQVKGDIITVDENGNGNGVFTSFPGSGPLTGVPAPDPGPGGAPNALTYSFPSVLGTPGDVLIIDAPGGPIMDVIRFNGTAGGVGKLVFYSFPDDGAETLADRATPSLPASFYANNITMLEVGTETANGLSYTPVGGQPGFGGIPTTYIINSDGPAGTPEPASLTLLGGMGIAGIAAYAWRRRKTAT
jgi:hypothetical protein